MRKVLKSLCDICHLAVRLICPDTIEEKIMKMQANKKELVSDLIKTDVGILKRLGKADLLGLVAAPVQ